MRELALLWKMPANIPISISTSCAAKVNSMDVLGGEVLNRLTIVI